MSQTHNQLVASHEQMDIDEAQERVQRILHGQEGPTLTPAPQTQPQAPATRKTRSDKGTHKPKAPADPDEIVLKMSIGDAREAAKALSYGGLPEVSAMIQDQVIACLQKRLDLLQKQK